MLRLCPLLLLALGSTANAQDQAPPPPAQRMMAERAGAQVVETPGSHSVYVSRPEVVARLVSQAAEQAVEVA